MRHVAYHTEDGKRECGINPDLVERFEEKGDGHGATLTMMSGRHVELTAAQWSDIKPALGSRVEPTSKPAAG